MGLKCPGPSIYQLHGQSVFHKATSGPRTTSYDYRVGLYTPNELLWKAQYMASDFRLLMVDTTRSMVETKRCNVHSQPYDRKKNGPTTRLRPLQLSDVYNMSETTVTSSLETLLHREPFQIQHNDRQNPRFTLLGFRV